MLNVTSQREAEEARAQLFTSLSHELRIPWAPSSPTWRSSLLDIAEETRAQSLRLFWAETRRLARMVHLMLEPGCIDLVDLADRAISALSSQAEGQGTGMGAE